MATVTLFSDQDQLYNSIKMHPDADVFHCHNEPSWFVSAVKEVFPDKPVVLDVHDSFLLRRSEEEIAKAKNPEYYRESVDERNNIQLADGLVYVCKPMKRIVEQEYKPDVPSLVLPSYIPERFNRIDFDRWLGGLVYEGRIDIDDELGDKWDFFQYANYVPLANKAREIKMDFHIYTPRKNEKVREIYGSAAFLHTPVDLGKLTKRLGRHDWGLVGNLQPFEEWKHALPNKLFEYMGGCVPVVAMHADECAQFIQEHGVGIVVESLEELAERWREHRECRKVVIKKRSMFAMEKHIQPLIDMYAELTCKRPQK